MVKKHKKTTFTKFVEADAELHKGMSYEKEKTFVQKNRFEALVDENNQYLVENYSITYLSSGRDLLQLTTKARKTSAAVLLGDPNYGKKDKIATQRSFNKTSSNIALPRLLETADEVKAIGKLLGVQPLLRGAATEKAIKRAQNPFRTAPLGRACSFQPNP